MEDLFRFILARPAQLTKIDKDTIPVKENRELHKALVDAKANENSSAAIRKVASAYAESKSMLRAAGDLKYGKGLITLAETLRNGEDRKLIELSEAIKSNLGADAAAVVKDADFTKDREHLCDTLVVNAILCRDVYVTSDDAAMLLRITYIIERTATKDKTLEKHGAIAHALEMSFVLPADIFPIKSDNQTGRPQQFPQPPESADEQRIKLKLQREKLFAAYSVLTRIEPDQIAEPTASIRAATFENKILSVREHAELRLPPTVSGEPPKTTATDAPSNAALSGVTSRISAAPLILKASVQEAFHPEVKSVLAERKLDLTSVNVPTAVDRLALELADIDMQLAPLENVTHLAMLKVGNSYVEKDSLVGIFEKGGFANKSIPSTHGSLAPAGIGDLLVVKQFLKRYEARELAHIENVLKGEYKERFHSRSRTTEETITIETETKKEEERDQQTTERFELKTESSQIQKEDSSLKVGLAISGKYGPVVEFKASTDFALNTSKEEASKVATSYSKDVTNRATSRVFERRTEQRILKTIEVFEEKNTHGIDNKSSSTNVIGQYQWVDKVYEAQVFNYGKRMLFDIMLPEPAAFLLYATTNQPVAGADLVKPAPFNLLPTDITEWNYAYYIKQYQVVGVTPPPQPYLEVSEALEGKGSQSDGATKALKIPLPDGYRAIGYEWQSKFNRWDNGTLDVVLLPEPVGGRTGTFAVTVKSWKVEAFTLAVGIHCQRTDRALDDWRLKTHSAILQAYQKQLRDYEEKLAALQVQAAQQFQGRNPTENEQLIRTEMKKGAISTFTAQHFDLFGAITSSIQGYPQPDLAEAEAEGKYIRFFEQAFEWEQMMYFFYPYFWGRKNNWTKRALMEDVDPSFAEFVKAGSARVVLSVRPGFEKAIAHFLTSGQIWDGGDLPDVTSPMYVSIIDEIRERDKAPGSEVAQGDPWEVRLPTTLVKLRDKSDLPSWEKNSQGEWVPL